MEREYPPIDSAIERTATRAIGAAIRVHTVLGPGLLESHYRRAMVHELGKRGLRVEEEVEVPVRYDGVDIGGSFRLDLLVDDHLIVELKAVEATLPVHRAQVLSYLRATGLRLGLLMNFNVSRMKHGIRRLIL